MQSRLAEEFAGALSAVDGDAVSKYQRCARRMLTHVNEAMEGRSDLPALVGPNHIEVMRSNHANHVSFMSFAFEAKSAGLLIDVVAWVYGSYIARGFDPEYFPVELTAWKEAVSQCIGGQLGAPVLNVYDLMVKHHNDFVELSKLPPRETQVEVDARQHFEVYLAAILEPNVEKVLAASQAFIRTATDLRYWWLRVVQPSMYEVGRRWSTGQITVAQEHEATSVTQRVMAVFYPLILPIPRDRGTIVFCAPPGELHGVGPRMMADLLESYGWNVLFAGADAPSSRVVQLLRTHSPRALCISTTVPSNLGSTKSLINDVRSKSGADVRVTVGGQAYLSDQELWRAVGADCYAQEIDDAVQCIETAAGHVAT